MTKDIVTIIWQVVTDGKQWRAGCCMRDAKGSIDGPYLADTIHDNYQDALNEMMKTNENTAHLATAEYAKHGIIAKHEFEIGMQ